MKRKFLPFLILLFSVSSMMAQQVNITFEVNTSAMASVDPAGIFLAGGTGFGLPGDNPLTDPDGDGVFTTTVQRDQGFASHYTFLNGNCADWSCKENIAGLSCADPNNFNDRFLPSVTSDTTITACFGTCDPTGMCAIVTDSVDITFQLNTSTITPDMGGIFIAGGGNFGNPGDFPMTDNGNGVYEITVRQPVGFFSFYTFTNGNCPDYSCKENLAGLPCGDPNNFNDRSVGPVMSDTTVMACFGNCADDGTCDVVLMPNLPMDFESADITYAPAGFGDVNFGPIPTSIEDNPFMDADNGSAKVWKVTKTTGAQTWAGASIDLASPMDFSTTSTIKVKFYSAFAGIPVQVKIENLADPAVSAEVMVNTTVDAGWETLVFDMSTSTVGTFDPAIEYGRFVVFPDFGNTPMIGDIDFYFDDAELDIIISDKPNLPVDFENTALDYGFGLFGNVDIAEIIDNPDPSGNNTSAKVWQISKPEGAETWAGAFFDLESPADLSNPVFTVNVWTPDAGTPVLLKMEDSNDGTIATELLMTTSMGGAWETLTFDLSTVGTFDPTHNYDRVVLFPNFGNPGVVGGASYYFDDVAQGMVTATLPTLPITFEEANITYTATGFGNLNPSVIANPDASGENTSATVVALEKTMGAEVWAGASMPLESAIDWSNGTTLTVKVWSPNAGTPFLLKIEDVADPTNISAEVLATSTTANAWETLTYDMTTSTVGTFDPANNYNQVIIFPNFGNMGTGTTYYADDFALFSVPVELPTLPITFEEANITYTNNGFGEAISSVIANPDASGSNTSATVLSLEKPMGAEVWAGTAMPLETAIDWSLQPGNVLSVKVWSPRADVPVLLKIEDVADPGNIFTEVQTNTTVANAWETLVFNMASGAGFDPSATYNQVVLFGDFGNPGAGETFYFDDIMNDADVSISDLDKAKVVVNAFPNPTEQELNVRYSIPVSGNITFDVVDILGRTVQTLNEGNVGAGNYQTVLNLNGLNSGAYYLITRLDGEVISTKNIMKK